MTKDTPEMFSSLSLAVCLGVVWGTMWALALQFTRWGRWLAIRRTWLTVVVGVGMDGLILLLVLPFNLWLQAAAVIAASSVGIITRSLINEFRDEQP